MTEHLHNILLKILIFLYLTLLNTWHCLLGHLPNNFESYICDFYGQVGNTGYILFDAHTYKSTAYDYVHHSCNIHCEVHYSFAYKMNDVGDQKHKASVDDSVHYLVLFC